MTSPSPLSPSAGDGAAAGDKEVRVPADGRVVLIGIAGSTGSSSSTAASLPARAA
ncbi:hypothetical protein GPECTOR_27g644 [Gonium pectorale]|uniref:Uncharacterized protein n=1 Tax=Gonium pectorale TaxID=33097 RepID=A0A150GF70_GONPE|nr:hypothetical protein GPECTOR_27g644 [Gonium pectorale]|eukprot:KXZ48474.1 hypothetical protein GPECTOR_27g644 [Gonium pectorale]